MQSAKNRLSADDVRFAAAVARTGLLVVAIHRRQIGNARTERHVWTVGIVMGNPGFQNEPQMRCGQGNQPIQTLAANRADGSLADRIGLGTAWW